MPLNVSSAIGGLRGILFSSGAFNGFLSNALCVAFTLTIVIMMIILLMYPCKPGTSFGTILRAMLYIFMALLAVIILRDGLQKTIFDDAHTDKHEVELIDRVTGRGETSSVMPDDDAVPIVPQLLEPELA